MGERGVVFVWPARLNITLLACPPLALAIGWETVELMSFGRCHALSFLPLLCSFVSAMALRKS